MSVGIVGYGRFGHALAGLCQAAGHTVRAFDPRAEVPPEVRVGSLAELAAFAELIIVAVPLDQMEGTFAALAPLVTPKQTVVDVGSVKTHPSQWMAQHLGDLVPWAASHPLFGPASLARGERPLRVVVCPNAQQADAVARVKAFYEGLGCTVFELSAEAHDQQMALTHALAFYVAKGMLDTGVPADAPLAPPSFQGMARSIEAVRVDAGHLFAALHRFNPFAPAARRRLLEALAAADRQLSAAGPTTPPSSALAIPDLGAHNPELQETRELIDEVDQELLSLLARRAELSRRAARAKAQRGQGVVDPARELKLLEARRAHARELGLDPNAADEIFQAILRFSRALQQ